MGDLPTVHAAGSSVSSRLASNTPAQAARVGAEEMEELMAAAKTDLPMIFYDAWRLVDYIDSPGFPRFVLLAPLWQLHLFEACCKEKLEVPKLAPGLAPTTEPGNIAAGAAVKDEDRVGNPAWLGFTLSNCHWLQLISCLPFWGSDKRMQVLGYMPALVCKPWSFKSVSCNTCAMRCSMLGTAQKTWSKALYHT